MKNVKINRIAFGSFLFLSILSCSTSNNVVGNTGNITFDFEDSVIAYSGLFEDFSLIPLENKRECMLSKVRKIIVQNDNIYILEKGSKDAVFLFDKNGTFVKQIGQKGHANNEYIWIFDFTIKENGTVCILDEKNKLKQYNSNGDFMESQTFDTKNYYWTMDYHQGKYVLTSLYNGSTSLNERNCLLYFFNEDLRLIDEKVQISDQPMKDSPLHHTPSVCLMDNKCVYFDQFQNKFYVFDLNDLSNYDEYYLNTPLPYTYDDMISGDAYTKPYDKINSVFSNESKIFGWMSYKSNYCYYELDLTTQKAKVCKFMDFLILENMWYDNGYVYSIVQPSALQGLQDMIDKSLPMFSPEIGNAVNKYKDRLDSKNNYYILKMKIKDKINYSEQYYNLQKMRVK